MRLRERIQDYIEDFLYEQNEITIKIDELANQFSCKTSDINYVITNKFSKKYQIFYKSGDKNCITIKGLEEK